MIDLRVPSPIVLPPALEDARPERPIEIRLSHRRAPEREPAVTRVVLNRGGKIHCSIASPAGSLLRMTVYITARVTHVEGYRGRRLQGAWDDVRRGSADPPGH